MEHIALIAAVGQRLELGYQNQLLCHLPRDLQHFKELTWGHPVVMGRKTWDSLPKKPLPNRRNIILSKHWEATMPSVEVFRSIPEILSSVSHDQTLFVMGGASVYQQFIPFADTIYLTRILSDFTADVFFPPLSMQEWTLVEDEFVSRDEKNPFDCRFQKYSRFH